MFSITTINGITFIYQGLTLVTHRPLWQARNSVGEVFSIVKISERRYDIYNSNDHFEDEVTTMEEAATWLIENFDEPW
jgi:hypothetical protein